MNNKTSYKFNKWMLALKLNFNMCFKIFIGLLLFYILAIFVTEWIFYKQGLINDYLFFKYSILDLIYGNLAQANYNLTNGVAQFISLFKYEFIRLLSIWGTYPFLIYIFVATTKKDDFIRGSQLIDIQDLKERIQEPVSLPLGELKLPISAEPKHMFIIGRPGTGKTNIYNQLITEVIKRKQKRIIYDTKLDFVPAFYNQQTDLLFNPLDIRCLGWNIFNDVETVMDLTAIAHSIIPSSPDNNNSTWYNVPRDILYGIFLHCYVNNRRTNKDVWQILSLGLSELMLLLKNTQGAERAIVGLGEDPTSKTSQNMFMMVMQYAKVFEFMQYIDGDFSIKKWVNSEDNNGLFITNYADIEDTLKPVIGLFIETLGRKLLSLPDDINRRLFMFLDEFGTLQKMDTIIRLLTASRSKGGAMFIGIQDIGRLDSIYGEKLRQSIVNACGNNLILAVEDSSDAQFASDKLGDIHYYEEIQSHSYGDNSDRVNVNKNKCQELLILPSQIQGLKDLTGYLKIANYGITYVEFEYKGFNKLVEAFIMKDEFKLESIQQVTNDHIIYNQNMEKFDDNEIFIEAQTNNKLTSASELL